MSAYLQLVLTAEHIAGCCLLLSEQTSEIAGLLAVVNEFGDNMRSVIKQNHILQWVPWLPGPCCVQNATDRVG